MEPVRERRALVIYKRYAEDLLILSEAYPDPAERAQHRQQASAMLHQSIRELREHDRTYPDSVPIGER